MESVRIGIAFYFDYPEKKYMKNIFHFLFTAILIAGLFGCGCKNGVKCPEPSASRITETCTDISEDCGCVSFQSTTLKLSCIDITIQKMCTRACQDGVDPLSIGSACCDATYGVYVPCVW